MRRFAGGDRLVHNEATAANVDGPENETFVDSGVEPTTPTDLEIEIASGDVFIEGDPVSVSSQTETVTDISGDVDKSAYRYHTLSVDSAGELVVDTSPTGEFDPETPDEEPITQVAEPQYPAGNCYLGFAFQVEDRIERVYDGRYVESGRVPTGAIIMWSGAIPDIPGGWSLCDGTDGTPDLTDRFVAGAGGQYDVGDTGGSDEHTLTVDEMPTHEHDYERRETSGVRGTETGGAQDRIGGTDTRQTETTGGDQPHENRPPFYALAYIQKL